MNANPSALEERSKIANVGRAIPDKDIEAAIASLESSTVAIEQQCLILEAQKRALKDLKARNESRGSHDPQQDRPNKLARERAQLQFQVDELAASVQTDLQISTKQADAAVAGLSPSIDRILEKDDHLLEGVQKLLPKLEGSASDEGAANEVDRLCQGLISLSAQEIRSRVDSVYRAHSKSQTNAVNGHHNTNEDKQMQSLIAELTELSGEIDSLATMAVDSQYRHPILRELTESRSEADSDRARWSKYVIATIQFLANRLLALEEHARHLQTHQNALKQVNEALEATLAAPHASKPEKQTNVQSPMTPQAKGLKPLRLVQANFTEAQDPVAQLLRTLDIKVREPSDIAKLADTLEQAQSAQRARLDQLSRATERSITDQLGETVVKAENDLRHLLAAVYTYTEYGTVKLGDEDIRVKMEDAEAKTQALGDEMKNLSIDDVGRQIREKQKIVLGK
jgi:hypothetical protein